ncbi:MAG TPA: peptidoglycan DD-metalloendopeptidase family protein, partial [Casimicrobiaceae bacterium]|nr:peptidoglycan DD-metalloendopeptidase family protein [Casimicrobiaceae bacterium]
VVATAPTPTPPAVPTAPTTASSVPSTIAPSGATKTSPKAIKEPYSDQAVRDLTLAASAVPAPPDTLALATPPAVRAEPKPEPRPEPKATPAPPPPSSSPAPATSGDSDALDWAWPAKGKIVAGFSETANLKGIDIAGTAGQAVTASAAGRVVYAGTGLRGYGKLIIIKHNATFLSAYAHNREILVKEGQQVARGQKIAEMGNTDADQVKLHFEIRRQGKPMDPTKYLPPA